ncbi:TniQ family protein [Rhodovulum sulfidophilum]|uniref:TniQ family protein n=1 Tax=Rhodovulum sulfidophilum TaxID=35806 RepID=UPI001F164610|nr:TniQ family protein [Rhodovulum sulfidophilum]MCE8418864.1 TniQ family protein [Rhodovulum sulfidophilum]MCE8441148.1 TniQ family protein [Rhodovulum sulfidophilum]MCE8468616.1 TniQ family protein [Rhodovulum sulfidophilum]
MKLTVSPREGETTLSVVSRLALRNGASFVQDFCADMGVSWRDAANGEAGEIHRLADLAGLDVDGLAAHSVVRVAHPGYRVNKQYLTSKTLVRRELRVCPRCLCEDDRQGGALARYGRLEWLVATYRTCHIHQVPMLTLPDADYPRCRHDFSQRVRDHWRCISRAERELVPSSGLGDLETDIASRIRGLGGHDHARFLDLDLMCRLSEDLGVVLRFGASTYPSKLNRTELARTAEAGFQAIAGGPDALTVAFGEIKVASSSPTPGFQADFGVLARRIERVDHGSPRYAHFLDRLTEFAFNNYPYGKGDVLFGRTCPERRVHNLASAASAHGLNYSRMYRIAVGMGLGTTEQAERIEFSAADHDDQLADYAACRSPKQSADYLGIRGEMLNRLVSAGLIAPRFDLPGLNPIYHPDDLKHIVDPLITQATLMDCLPSGYASLVNIGAHAKCRFETVMRLACDEKLASLIRLNASPKLDGLFVSLDDLRDQLEEPPPPGFTRSEARRMLGINSSTIAWLIRKGWLEARTVRHHRHRRSVTLISPEALEEFLIKYVTLGMMAAAAHTQALHVARKLENAGIFPLDLDRKCSKIYTRSDRLDNIFSTKEI